jgi:hypothetical protein
MCTLIICKVTSDRKSASELSERRREATRQRAARTRLEDSTNLPIMIAQPAGPSANFEHVIDTEGNELDEARLKEEAFGGDYDPMFKNVNVNNSKEAQGLPKKK